MTSFKKILRDKETWKSLSTEGSVVLIVAMILFFDPLLAWVSKPSVNPNEIEIVEKATRQIATRITYLERDQIFNQVHTLNDNGEIDKALDLMQQYLRRDPANAEAHYLIGIIYLKGGKIQSAFDHLQQVVEIKFLKNS
jgi:tetratricopeptide (TPR) repeat protein